MELESDGSTEFGCHQPKVGSRFARICENCSDSDRVGRIGARDNYSSGIVPVAVIQVTSPTRWQEALTTECIQYARSMFPEYVDVGRKRVENKAKRFSTVGLPALLPGEAGDEMVTSEMKELEVQRPCQVKRKTGLEGFYYRRVFRGDEMVKYGTSKELEVTI